MSDVGKSPFSPLAVKFISNLNDPWPLIDKDLVSVA